jgi:hypothetical protein
VLTPSLPTTSCLAAAADRNTEATCTQRIGRATAAAVRSTCARSPAPAEPPTEEVLTMASSTVVTVRLSDEQIVDLRARIDAAAGEFKGALNAVRELHKPHRYSDVTPLPDWAICDACYENDSPHEPASSVEWPYPTARLVYTDDEVAALQP